MSTACEEPIASKLRGTSLGQATSDDDHLGKQLIMRQARLQQQQATMDPIKEPLRSRPRLPRFQSEPRVSTWSAQSLFVEHCSGSQSTRSRSSIGTRSIFSTSVKPRLTPPATSYFSPSPSPSLSARTSAIPSPTLDAATPVTDSTTEVQPPTASQLTLA